MNHPPQKQEPRVSRLALGTVQFGMDYGIANQNGQISYAGATKIVQMAAAAGMDTIDTAMGYGNSESCLGEIGTQGFNLVTKLPRLPAEATNVQDWVVEEIRLSLLRLNVPRVDSLLLHRPLDLLEKDGKTLFRALQSLKEATLVSKIGVSIYNPEMLSCLLTNYRFDIVQAPLNLVDQRFSKSGWLFRLKDKGVEIHTRSTFLQGLLLLPRHFIPAKFARWNDIWDDWHHWLHDRQETALQASLAFPLSFTEVDRVLVGVDSVNQLQQILTSVARRSPSTLPDLACEADALVNPSNWANL